MKKLKKLYAKLGVAMTATMCTVAQAFATEGDTVGNEFDEVVSPVVTLIGKLVGPLLAVVCALGAPFCVILGVKYAKAQEPQEREKAKSNLKNAIIGFALIFILLVVLRLLVPVMQNWAKGYSAL